MAQQIGCDLCGEEPAVMLQTNIDSGEVIAVGAACLVPFYLGGVRGLAADMPPEVGQSYWPAVAELAGLPAWGDHLPAPGATPAKGGRKPRSAAAKAPGESPAGPGAEDGSGPHSAPGGDK